MKYMGSKRALLQNGLGEILAAEIAAAQRFVDLFAGSGAVAIYVARKEPIPVLAFDLQHYSAVLTGAVVCRQTPLDWKNIWAGWLRRAQSRLEEIAVPQAPKLTQTTVAEFRAWCRHQKNLPITAAYGGHYFSPNQAVSIDAFRSTLPAHEPNRTVALAALIQAASQCAASPGHTAQPFQPTSTAKPFLEEAWGKNIAERTKETFASLAQLCAQHAGSATVADANQAATQVLEGDLAFIDPPYSGVHYSRFYHVLETIARGGCGEVTGVGRYPAPALRPRSKYSVRTETAQALDDLLRTLASRRARAILTFPDHDCSNGLSGVSAREIAARHFRIAEYQVESNFSTLGGTGGEREGEAGRAPRRQARELILVLRLR